MSICLTFEASNVIFKARIRTVFEFVLKVFEIE